MRSWWISGLVLWISSGLWAEVSPVELSVREEKVWTGERVRFSIELRARGSFSGAAVFDLPEVPGTLLLKTGNPVVGSRDIEGESWFTQSHEFSLFSQRTGELGLPSFSIRFAAREGFTGDPKEVVAMTEPVVLEIDRPPGSESIPFLVTSTDLAISESWDPAPGESTVGDVIRRTIFQRSQGVPGMALVPAPRAVPEGVRLYEPEVETRDNTERGAFRGERQETLTYLLQQAGTVSFPEMEFTWWNPETEKLESKRLPSVVIEVAPPPAVDGGGAAKERNTWLPEVVLLLAISSLVWWQRLRVMNGFYTVRVLLDPPERRAARRVLRACRRNDARAAQHAWSSWRSEVSPDLRSNEELERTVLEMQRVLFGAISGERWEGENLARAFRAFREESKRKVGGRSSRSLPALNG